MTEPQSVHPKVLCFEAQNQLLGDNDTSLLKLALDYAMGGGQTIVRRLPDLLDQLDTAKTLPDAIIVHDRSRQPTGGLIDIFSRSAGTHIAPLEDLPAVKALKLLKDPESPYRDIPVVIFNAFIDNKPDLIEQGADLVITSEDFVDIHTLPKALGKLLGNEYVAPKNFGDTPPTIIIEPQRFTAIIPPLEGFQIPQFQNFLMLESQKRSTPDGIMQVVRSDHFQEWDWGLSAEMEKRGTPVIAAQVSSILAAIAQRVTDEEINTKDQAISVIAEEVKRSGEPDGRIVHVLLLMTTAQAMYGASHTAMMDGVIAEFMPHQLRSLKAMLQNRVTWLKKTESLGIAQAAHLQRDLGIEGFTEDVVAEMDRLDEKAMARSAANILFEYVMGLDTESHSNSWELKEFLDRIPESVEHARMAAGYLLELCMERVRNISADPQNNLTEAQVDRIVHILGYYGDDPAIGPKTQALLQEVGDRLSAGMASEDVKDMISVLAEFNEYSGVGGWPERNALREVTSIMDQVMAEPQVPPPAPPAP